MKVAARVVLACLTLVVTGCAASPADWQSGEIRVHKFTARYSNTYLVTGAAGSFLFDSGFEEDGAALAESVRGAGVDPAALKAIILSHGHHDHAGGAAYLRRTYGVPVIAGAGDAGLVRDGRNDRLCPQGFFASRRVKSDQSGKYAGFEPDVLIADTGDLLALTGVPGEIVALPGHTPGSLVVTVGDFAFVGDLVRGGVFSNATATTHFYLCDLADNTADLQALYSEIAPQAALIFTGHFGPLDRESLAELIDTRRDAEQ